MGKEPTMRTPSAVLFLDVLYFLSKEVSIKSECFVCVLFSVTSCVSVMYHRVATLSDYLTEISWSTTTMYGICATIGPAVIYNLVAGRTQLIARNMCCHSHWRKKNNNIQG